jgi:Xaa-Pro aminopeptidase
MQTMNTALVVGPFDWDPGLLPQVEFEERIAAAMRVTSQYDHVGLIVQGAVEENAEIVYLTGFTPKLGFACALIAPGKPVRILCAEGAAMIAAAKRLTWVEDIKPLRDAGKDIAAWLGEIAAPGHGTLSLGLWGGATMTGETYNPMMATLKDVVRVEDLDGPLNSLRRRKSSRELQLMRRGARILAAAADAFSKAKKEGAGARTASIAAERAAYALGAQEIRVSASGRSGGPPLPFDGIEDRKVDPMLIYIAVRFAGYWADGLMTLTDNPSGATARTGDALAAVIAAVRPGLSGDDLAQVAQSHLGHYHRYKALKVGIGSSIGLSLKETPDFNEDGQARLEEGGVYSLQVGASGEGSDNALASAVIAIENGAIETLWRTPV